MGKDFKQGVNCLPVKVNKKEIKVVEAKKRMVRAIATQVNEETLKADLENYRQQALQLGATQAEVIPASWIMVDERVRLKCFISRCPNYDRCGYCPPYTPEPDFVRKALSRYSWAVLFKNDVPAADFADLARYYPHGKEHQKKTDKIAAKVETLAFADGYRFAMGLGAGGCRDTLCNGGLCHWLDSGRCPHILVARPSIEALGIDVCDLVNKVGWTIYPVYRTADPETVPCGTSVGMVIVH